MPKIVIKNGMIVDGSGNRGYKSDILIEDDIIREISPKFNTPTDKEINADGMIVCPGFIDIHSHADITIFRKDHPDRLKPLLMQGITTFVGGNCGLGLAPIDDGENRNFHNAYIETFSGIKIEDSISWSSTGKFLDFLEKNKVALNTAVLAPHGMLRIQAMGMDKNPANKYQTEKMKSLLRKCLEEGAFGLSTGLQYFPGMYSDTDELVNLSKTLTKYNAVFSCHLRSYSNTTIHQALREVAEVAASSETHAQVSHIFLMPWMGRYQDYFNKIARFLIDNPNVAEKLMPDYLIQGEMERVVGFLDRMKKISLDIGMDVMPTTNGMTHLLSFFPPWLLYDGLDEILKRLSDYSIRKELLHDIENGIPNWPHNGRNDWSLNIFKYFGWQSVIIMAVGSEKNRDLQGRRITDIAAEKKMHPLDFACDLLVEEKGRVLIYGSIGRPEDNVTEKVKFPAFIHPDISVGTDTVLMDFGKPYHLFYGCYPKFIREYSINKKIISTEEAIRKCTSLPANQFGIKKRGLIKPGFFADIVVLDPEKISSSASFEHPEIFPEGIAQVIVNGKIVVNNGEYFPNAYAGKVLRYQDQ